jgi:PAP2 superfamily
MRGNDLLNRRLSAPGEAAIVATVLLLWQAIRVPIEGGSTQALSHARTWERLHHRLGLSSVQNRVINLVHHHVLLDVARWSYSNIHVFSIFAFMVAVRLAAPSRYPTVRSAFVLLHVPALIAIAAYPLGSPSWLPHPPQWAGHTPLLGGGWSAGLRNQTAAVASEHFGYAVLIASVTLWLAPRKGIAAPVLLYPPFVFMVIVGTGHHFPLDAVVGSACVALGLSIAVRLHRGLVDDTPGEPVARWVPLAVAAGLLAGWVDALSGSRVDPVHPALTTLLAPAVAAGALAYGARVGRIQRERRSEA